jgi:hypothetical protein|tara:strand:+ start:1168 stop:1398 length:231 start_codon:yes stop_codon:yes gene_type:complete
MKVKVLSPIIPNPNANTIDNATLVRVVATASTIVLIAGEINGSVRVPANGVVDIVKYAADVLTCPTSDCTKIAYTS